MLNTICENLFTVAEILSSEECRQLIVRGEAIGFERASVRTADGPKMRTDIRDNDRAEFDDSALAIELWNRCFKYLPESLEGGFPFAFDSSFRFYRYDPGQRFKRHKDGVVKRSETERSRLTCLFYLNDDFVGGETVFYSHTSSDGTRPEIATIVPKTGMALFFLHEWWHEGRSLSTGRKYVLRSDVFFRFLQA